MANLQRSAVIAVADEQSPELAEARLIPIRTPSIELSVEGLSLADKWQRQGICGCINVRDELVKIGMQTNTGNLIVVGMPQRAGAGKIAALFANAARQVRSSHVIGPIYGSSMYASGSAPAIVLAKLIKDARAQANVPHMPIVVVIQNRGLINTVTSRIDTDFVGLIRDIPNLTVVIVGHQRLIMGVMITQHPIAPHANIYMHRDHMFSELEIFSDLTMSAEEQTALTKLIVQVGGQPELWTMLQNEILRHMDDYAGSVRVEECRNAIWQAAQEYYRRGLRILQAVAAPNIIDEVMLIQIKHQEAREFISCREVSAHTLWALFSCGLLRIDLRGPSSLAFAPRNEIALRELLNFDFRPSRRMAEIGSGVWTLNKFDLLEIDTIKDRDTGRVTAALFTKQRVTESHQPPWRQPRFFLSGTEFEAQRKLLTDIMARHDTNPGDPSIFLTVVEAVQRLIPEQFSESVTECQYVHLTTNAPEIPWEIFELSPTTPHSYSGPFPVPQHFGIRCAVGRALRTDPLTASGREPRSIYAANEPISSALVIIGSRPDKHAELEVREIAKALHSCGVDEGNVELLQGREWNRWLRSIMEGEKKSKYDIVHFVAHDPEIYGMRRNPVLQLDENVHVLGEEIQSLLASKKFIAKFVFVNMCNAAQHVASLQVSPVYHFIRHGSMLVAPLWRIDSQDAAKFAVEFYRRLSTCSVGELLRQLRELFRGSQDPEVRQRCFWASYVLYGDPRIWIARSVASYVAD